MKKILGTALLAQLILAAGALGAVNGTGTVNTVPVWTATDTLGSSIMTQSGDGIGIGTTATARRLVVDVGSTTNGGMRLTRTSATNVPYLDFLLNTASTPFLSLQAGDGANWRALALNPNGGRVGIGITSPQAALDVMSYDYGIAVRAVDPAAMATGFGAGMAFVGKYTAGGTYTPFGWVRGAKLNGTDGNMAGKLMLQVADGTGTSTTVATFQAGQMSFTGNANFVGAVTGTSISATYQDVAEWVPASDDLTPGTVVVINPNRVNEVMASTTAYDTGVAGVVSAQPGIVLGQRSETKEQIATTGRVRVHVDATKAPIAVGDLLVTSDHRGVAMKSVPMDVAGMPIHRPGTIVGKALEPLAGGEGEILVLLSLQ